MPLHLETPCYVRSRTKTENYYMSSNRPFYNYPSRGGVGASNREVSHHFCSRVNNFFSININFFKNIFIADVQNMQ